MQFLDVVDRQAHPGERHSGTARTREARRSPAATRWRNTSSGPCSSTTSTGPGKCYGGLSASVYLLDAEGRIAFYGLWGQAPALREAMEDLSPEAERQPRPAKASIVFRISPPPSSPDRGPRARRFAVLRRPRAGLPGAGLLMSVGWLARPLLKPLVLRTTPAPARTGALLLAGLSAGTVALIWKAAHHRKEPDIHRRCWAWKGCS